MRFKIDTNQFFDRTKCGLNEMSDCFPMYWNWLGWTMITIWFVCTRPKLRILSSCRWQENLSNWTRTREREKQTLTNRTTKKPNKKPITFVIALFKKELQISLNLLYLFLCWCNWYFLMTNKKQLQNSKKKWIFNHCSCVFFWYLQIIWNASHYWNWNCFLKTTILFLVIAKSYYIHWSIH